MQCSYKLANILAELCTLEGVLSIGKIKSICKYERAFVQTKIKPLQIIRMV